MVPAGGFLDSVLQHHHVVLQEGAGGRERPHRVTVPRGGVVVGPPGGVVAGPGGVVARPGGVVVRSGPIRRPGWVVS